MYSLFALLLFLPLYFSHFFAPVGLIIGDSSSFERQKMYFFILCVCIGTIEAILGKRREFLAQLKKSWIYITIALLLPIFASQWGGTFMEEYFFLGSFEKHHGYIWYVGLIFLALLVSILSNREKRNLFNATIIGSVGVAFFGIFEYIVGSSVFFHTNIEVAWSERRSVSTLGNPNYVAGYLLLCLPLFSVLRKPERFIYGILIILGILVTGSYIGIGILSGYLLYTLISTRVSRLYSLLIIVCLGIVSGWIALSYLPHDKFLSLISRFVLMREIGTVMVAYPLSFVLGFGPESIITYFEGTRSAIIDAYFPTTSAIDSTHNILLDILFQYGVIPLYFVFSYLIKRWNILEKEAQEGIILGLLFLTLNVTVTVHLIVLVLFLFLYRYDVGNISDKVKK